jgi:hypothetical protein
MSAKANKEIILAGLDKARNNTLFQDSWWSDEALVKALLERFKIDGLCVESNSKALSQFNNAISRTPKYTIIDSQYPVNSNGTFRMQMRVTGKNNKRCSRYFYYFSSSSMAAGPPPLTLANAQEYYNRELRSSPRNKRPRIHCEDDESITGSNEDGVEIQSPLVNVPTYSYWESTEARKLFMAREST